MISWYKLKNYSSVFLVSEFIWLHKFLGKRIYKLLVKILNKGKLNGGVDTPRRHARSAQGAFYKPS